MKQVALSLFCLTLLFAGLDSATASAQISHREASGWLFASTWFSWAAWATLVSFPVLSLWALLGRVRPRSVRGAARDAAFLSFIVLGGPVLVYAGLDASLPAGAGGGGLLSMGAVLMAAVSIVGVVAIAAGLGRWAHLHGLAPLAGAAGLGLVAGMVDLSGGGVESPRAGAAPADAPNLLLMVLGSTRASSLSLYGNGRVTAPRLVERSAGMAIFDEARATSVSTVASSLSMLTGTYPGEREQRLAVGGSGAPGAPTLARVLGAAGYRTAAFVGSAALHGEGAVGEGFEVFDDQVDPELCRTRLWRMVHGVQSILAGLSPGLGGNGRPCWFKDLARPAEDVLASAANWIENGDSRPWFCTVYLADVGWPYRPSAAAAVRFVAPYDGAVDGYLFESNSYRSSEGVQGESLEEADLQYLVDLYEAELLELDGKVDEFLQQIEAAGRASGRELGSLITSDHGEALGEHGAFGHGGLEEVQVHVPWLLKAPDGRLRGRRVGKVSGVDVAPTLLAFAGVDRAPSMGGLDLTSTVPGSDRVIVVEGGVAAGAEDVNRAVYRGQWKLLLEGATASPETSLLSLNPEVVGEGEMSISYPEVVEELRSELRTMREGWAGRGEPPAR